MTNTPVRAALYVACEPITKENPTLRDLVEWSKRVTRAVENPSANEIAYITEAWSALVQAKAETEGVPAGLLSYMVQEIQLAEEQVLDQAMNDLAGDVQ